MNILIPDSWLREYLETKLSPEEIAAKGSLHGPSFERIEPLEGEPVYDIEVTTNRVDAMSVKGIARELAAILGEDGNLKDVFPKNQESEVANPLPLPQISVKTEKVNRILCVALDQVQNGESPEWMQKRLRQIGQNSHGIIIDMTNYITHELGHPCHAFDYDKIMQLGGEIVIKEAEKGKKFVTLDGEEHQTLGGEVVFESKTGEIIDLPAIKGTANSAIDEKTTRVLFWLENMEAMAVRQASMGHAIRTVAAVLNEKNVDPLLMDEVLAAGVAILEKHAAARVASEIYCYNCADKSWEGQIIEFDFWRLEEYLGVKIAEPEIRRILQALGFEILREQLQTWRVRPPSYRAHDVTMTADVIEEVARIYGYHLLPSKVNFRQVDIPRQNGVFFALEGSFKHFLAAAGLAEVYTYSMVSEGQITGVPEEFLKIANPLSEELVYLRQSLIPSLEEVYRRNYGKTGGIKGVFELARVYFPGETRQTVRQPMKLGILSPLPYREVRAIVEQLLGTIYVTITVTREGEIRLGEQKLGQITVLADGKVAVELDLAEIGKNAKKFPKLQALSDQPYVVEDLTFVMQNKPVGELLARLTRASELLKAVKLKDVYQDNYTFNFTYQAADKAVTGEEVAAVRKKLVEMMAGEGCPLVGSLL